MHAVAAILVYCVWLSFGPFGVMSAVRSVLGWCLTLATAAGPRASRIRPRLAEAGRVFSARDFTVQVKKERLTVIMDMDECMIHSQFEDMMRSRGLAAQVNRDEADGIGDELSDVRHKQADFFWLDLDDGGRVKVNVRPHLDETLLRLSDEYDVHVFTAAVESYANPVLDLIDPTGQYFKQRFFRSSCTIVQDRYLKDLTVIKKDLSRVVLVDNNPISFVAQPSNGIPVPSWYDDPEDTALKGVVELIENELHHLDDVRPHLYNRFMLEKRLRPLRKHLTL